MTVEQQWRQESRLEGRQEGRQELAQEMARRMLAKQLDLATIIELTGLSEGELQQLRA
jgi:recombination-promoting nuclease RpnB